MSKRSKKPGSGRPPLNQRRTRMSFVEMLSSANQRAHEQSRHPGNRRGNRREGRSVQAAISAATPAMDNLEAVGWSKRLMRWVLGMLLLPFCWVTTWTLLSRFSRATVDQGFWQTAEFWHFAIGMLVMVGWFWSGLMKSFFLYLYVLGHELTHVLFVWCFLGKVSDFKVGLDGGYITTNKTNLVIALSPYFVPIWSIVAALVYLGLKVFMEIPAGWDKVFYGVVGLTWTFHFVWTLWMLPKDQPDLKENGVFLSLVVIYLGNLLVLVALMCVPGDGSLWRHCLEFGMEWLRFAATWVDQGWRWSDEMIGQVLRSGLW